jgi:O-6-methylguanine DNA methyltransferase
VVLDESGIDAFRRDVYGAAREVPPGKTVSYGEIAHAIGKPDAPRAVGAALAENPFPIVVPCHRVLSAGGELHGFSAPGGITTKRRMLEIERAPGSPSSPCSAPPASRQRGAMMTAGSGGSAYSRATSAARHCSVRRWLR